ncbi:MAG TPA: cytochrome c peroxidase [Parafilimonas sp.]|nr:cytochrome c peroxidase [Parafilimonas sp.]
MQKQPINKPFEIKYPSYFGNKIYIPEDNPTTEAGVYLGRMLFYETALSANDKLSCATCHKQELAFTDGKIFSTGVDGTLQPRNAMSLANLLWVKNLFWDGRANSLEEQAKTPLTNLHEMGQKFSVSADKLTQKGIYKPLFKAAFETDSITGEMIVRALAQFERTLVSADSRYDKYLRNEYQPTLSELNGINIFYGMPGTSDTMRGADCAHCHAGPKTYSELFQNNGLDSIFLDAGREKITGQAVDKGRFRVVTLRNIALTAPYMHDGRFKTLEDVIDHYNEHIRKSATLSPFLKNNSNNINGKLDLSQQEKVDLLAFLNMLTDSGFISNNNFSNPFLNQ